MRVASGSRRYLGDGLGAVAVDALSHAGQMRNYTLAVKVCAVYTLGQLGGKVLGSGDNGSYSALSPLLKVGGQSVRNRPVHQGRIRAHRRHYKPVLDLHFANGKRSKQAIKIGVVVHVVLQTKFF